MPIQFLDQRVSSFAPAAPVVIPTTPLLVGDIGLQTASVLPENAGDIRVELNCLIDAPLTAAVAAVLYTIVVAREGTPIYTRILLGAQLAAQPFGFTVVDYQPPAPVDGEIQYTVTIAAASLHTTETVARVEFAGSAAAGTTTG